MSNTSIMDKWICVTSKGEYPRGITPFDVTHPEPTFAYYHAYNYYYQKVMTLSLRLATKIWEIFLPILSKLVGISVKSTSVSRKFHIAFIFLHVQSVLWSIIILHWHQYRLENICYWHILLVVVLCSRDLTSEQTKKGLKTFLFCNPDFKDSVSFHFPFL